MVKALHNIVPVLDDLLVQNVNAAIHDIHFILINDIKIRGSLVSISDSKINMLGRSAL